MTVVTERASYLERPRPGGLAEVIDIILDKGLVIDIFIRVSLLGLELLTIDARIVVASVDTYLRWAEAVDRVVLPPASTRGVTDLLGDAQESGAKGKVKGAAKGAVESAKEAFGGAGEDRDEPERRPARDRGR
jgi:hypothetical protein